MVGYEITYAMFDCPIFNYAACSLNARSYYLWSLLQPGRLLNPSLGKAFSRLLEGVSQVSSVFVLICCDAKLVAFNYLEFPLNY